ncbi:MAG: peptidylprolyl isomerase [Prevotella sp.]|nr:peptidylprolyl isomerase [Bacteroides sp.]MCM1366165.1 peptidylprolyl isomerase [Prevotella sp.]MCM1436770.1 peptidylprolyl isomerase [Prevotella sp.]
MRLTKKTLGTILLLTAVTAIAHTNKNVIDEVAWVVGDEPIFRSEIEDQYEQMRQSGTPITGNPYCTIPEEMAVEKLFLSQAKLDTVEAQPSQVSAMVERRINYFITNLGSAERVEEYFHKSMPALREQLTELTRNNMIVNEVQRNLTKDIKATPNDVKRYFANLPKDSIPYVPMQVEAQVITLNPIIPRQEIEDVKSRLREFTERINNGESSFSTLAIMYSEDGSSMQGGELGFHNRADFVPEFANVAWNLNDPSKVSRIVETEFGFHIIQLIEKRGDMVNVRHILLRPKVASKDLDAAVVRLDSLRKEIIAEKFPFEEAARYVSQDKDTKNNNGLMMNPNTGSSKFEMQELPAEVARQIETMKPGEISQAFIMKDQKKNSDVVAIVKLKSRTDGHMATIADDYNLIKDMYEEYKREEIIRQWVENKIKNIYVRIEDGWDGCDFKYSGWIKD